MGRIWDALVAHATDKIEEKVKEIKNAPSKALERLEQTIRDTGKFGEELLGPQERYGTGLLTDLAMPQYFATVGRKPEDYSFEVPMPFVAKDGTTKIGVIKPFQIPVYVPKGMDLNDAVAIELKKLTEKGKIFDFEYLAQVGLVERIHYQVGEGQGVPKRKSMWDVLKGDQKRISSKEFKYEPKAKGGVYSVVITPMVPKYGIEGGVPILLGQDPNGVYRPLRRGPTGPTGPAGAPTTPTLLEGPDAGGVYRPGPAPGK